MEVNNLIRKTVLAGGQELEDDEDGRGPQINLSDTSFWR